MHWAGFTLLIKGLEGLICGLIVKKLNKKDKFYIDIDRKSTRLNSSHTS